MNKNSDVSKSKNKCSCIKSIFTSCFQKKISEKKNISDQNSELDYILSKKNGLSPNEKSNKRHKQFRINL